MDVHFRSVRHTADEIAMGQVYWHYPIAGCDAISATANTSGFSPLVAIGQHFGWDHEDVNRAAAACNAKEEVCVTQFTPTLFLVPATKGSGECGFLIRDLIAAIHATDVMALHFTHYGFIQNRLPTGEVSEILDTLFQDTNSLHLNRLVVDVDARVESQFYKLLAQRSGKIG